MTFKRRLKLYLTGFAIGFIMLSIILSKRGCTGLNERKVQELALQTWKMNEVMRCKLNCLGLTNDTLFLKALRDNCDLNSAKSNIHEEPCGKYVIETKPGVSPSFTLLVADCKNTSELLDVAGSKNCDCK